MYQPTLAHKVITLLCIPSLTEIRPGNPVRRTGSTDKQNIRGQSLLQLLGETCEDQAAHLLHVCRGPGLAHVPFLIGPSVSGSFQWSRLFNTFDLPVES